MSKLLTPDEVAALVQAAREGRLPDAAAEPTRRAGRLHKVDFNRPQKFSVEQQRRVRRAMESFGAACALRLSSQLRCQVELELISTVQLTWASAQAQRPPRSLATVLELQPLGTVMVLSIEKTLALMCLDRLLGGSAPTAPPERRFSEIDQTLMEGLTGLIFTELSLVWQEAYSLGLTIRENESGETDHIMLASEPTLLGQFEVRVAGSSFTLSLLIPWSSLAPALSGEADRAGADTSAKSTAIGRGISRVPVTLHATVPMTRMTPEQVLSLTPGTVIEFEARVDDGLILSADSVPLARVTAGAKGIHRAVQLQAHEGGRP